MRVRLAWFLLLIGFLSGPLSAHPMDEWFIDIQWTTGKGMEAQVRVPTDQWAKLQETPLVFETSTGALSVKMTEAGTDDSTRTLVMVSANESAETESLTIKIPPGLLDENQSLVGFIRFDGGEPVTLFVLAGQSKSFSPPLESEEEAPKAIGAFFQFGLQHIVEGYDHLLFLFCLLIPGGTFRHFLVVVTSFTVGHSLTLGASVLGYISLPSALTESMIALSIVVAALFNLRLFRKRSEGPEEAAPVLSRGLMAGGFGLIHGLGFAGLLMEVGIKGSGALAPLVGFNLGVEAGQLAIVAVFFPILVALYRWKHRNPVLVGSSLLAAAVGAYWFFERVGLF